MKHMIRVLYVVTTLLAGTAAQAQVKVADSVNYDGGRFTGLDYGVNEQLGRAWLVLHFAHTGICADSDSPCDVDEPVQVRLRGLTYDAAKKQVTYQAGGSEPVVCAKVVTRHVFFLGDQERIDATGQCGHEVAPFKRFVDDGFSGRVDQGKEILFRAAGQAAVADK